MGVSHCTMVSPPWVTSALLTPQCSYQQCHRRGSSQTHPSISTVQSVHSCVHGQPENQNYPNIMWVVKVTQVAVRSLANPSLHQEGTVQPSGMRTTDTGPWHLLPLPTPRGPTVPVGLILNPGKRQQGCAGLQVPRSTHHGEWMSVCGTRMQCGQHRRGWQGTPIVPGF